MKLATYISTASARRLPASREWLEREQPDIAALQELKCADNRCRSPISRRRGTAPSARTESFNGVAVLAKGDAPELRRVGLPGDPDDTHSRY